ncbi:MAG TPA: hypothetical protein P5275_09175 [Saprospiraceae bacterium]|nr:hypothetical protein [Saprospiraceae bacterium]HPQ98228.1 hypothetical protein [Saprospiraceae bacterium]HQU54442.1 hypothetical protein [Saprospiraceae bacterium]HRV85020.1 hypothetical protein [Saprospiraceae bacterium]
MEDKTLNEKPPLTKSWSSWYAIVLAFFVVLVILFFVLTKMFAP